MKRNVIILFCLIALMPVLSQTITQQGVVKTRGRMVNGVLQPGKGLQGATVQIKDRQAVVSGASGNFSFPLQSNTYSVQSVKKQGYQLVDMEVCRNYKRSADPLYLVMETPDQKRSDLLTAERKIRRNLQRQLQEREDEIESLKVSQQEKDSLLSILYQQQGDNEKLIADMTKRYSTLDYDQLDDFYRQISWFIENGELTHADSLLHTRGDINAQVQNISRQGQAIQEQEAHLKQAKTVHQANIDEAARRCYSYYESFFAQHQNDSAAHYLELRTVLDSTNLNWLNEVGVFVYKYLDNYNRAYAIFKEEWNKAVDTYGEESDVAIKAYINMLSVKPTRKFFYSNNGKKNSFFPLLVKKEMNYLFSICERTYGKDSVQLAIAYNNYGSILLNYGLIDEANDLYRQAIKICKLECNSNNTAIISVLNNIASACYEKGDYINASNHYNNALSKALALLSDKDPLLATIYNNLGVISYKKGWYNNAADYYQKAMSIRKAIYNGKHHLLADSYINLGTVLVKQQKFEQAKKQYDRALSIFSATKNDDDYNKAVLYNNIGLLHLEKKEYWEAVKNINMALGLVGTDLARDIKAIAIFKNNIGIAYYKLNDYEKAEVAFEHSMELSQRSTGLNIKCNSSNIFTLVYLKRDFQKAFALSKGRTYNPLNEALYGLSGNQLRMMEEFFDSFQKLMARISFRPRPHEVSIEYGGDDEKAEIISVNHDIINNEEYVLDILKTEDYYKKVIAKWSNEKTVNDTTMAYAYVNLADFYLFVNNCDTTNAKVYYTKALDILAKHGKANLLKAKILFCLGLCELPMKTDISISYFDQALNILGEKLGTDNKLVRQFKSAIKHKQRGRFRNQRDFD